ncbi:MAG: hypothetical protein Q8P57_03340 [Candidatus Pacearchaeota archaeon]|nr:hypothetical protein [Candidatus Pacearchaeota archaeon]
MLQTELEKMLESAMYALGRPLSRRVYGAEASTGALVDGLDHETPSDNPLHRLMQESRGKITTRQANESDDCIPAVERRSRLKEGIDITYDLSFGDDSRRYAESEDVDRILKDPKNYLCESVTLVSKRGDLLMIANDQDGCSLFSLEVDGPQRYEKEIEKKVKEINRKPYNPKEIIEVVVDFIRNFSGND